MCAKSGAFLQSVTTFSLSHLTTDIVSLKPIARLIGQLRRVIILLPNISVRQNSPSSALQLVFVLFNIADPDLHQDPASPLYCLSKWSLHRVT